MNVSLHEPLHSKSRDAIDQLRALVRTFETERGSTALYWGMRGVALVWLTYVLGSTSPHVLWLGLMPTLIYAALGIAGAVFRYGRWRRQSVRFMCAIVEVALISWCSVLSGSALSGLFVFYLLPLLAGVGVINARRLLGLLVLTELALAAVVYVLLATEGMLAMGTIYAPAAGALAIALLFATLRRRPSLLEDVSGKRPALLALFEESKDGVYVVDDQRRVVFANMTLQEYHGPLPLGATCESYLGCQIDYWDCSSADADAPDNLVRRSTARFVDQRGTPYHVGILACQLPDESGFPHYTLVMVRYEEQRVALLAEIIGRVRAFGSDHDQLAGRYQMLVHERERLLEMCAAIGQRLVGIASLEDLMQFVVMETRRRLSAEASALFLLEKNLLVCRAADGLPEGFEEAYAIGQGITGYTLVPEQPDDYGRTILENDVEANPHVDLHHLARNKQGLPSGQVTHLIAVPLNSHARSFGVLRVLNKVDTNGQVVPDGFSESDRDFLMTIAALVASAIEHAQLLQERTRLYDISRRLAHPTAEPDLFQTIVDAALECLPDAQKAAILRLDGSGTFVPEAVKRRYDSHGGKTPMAHHQGIAGQALHRRQLICVDDTALDKDFVDRGGTIRSLMVMPLIVANTPVGVLSVDSDRPKVFTQQDRRLLEAIASHAVIAYDKIARYRTEQTLREVAAVLNDSLDVASVLQRILDQMSRVISYDSTSIQILDQADNRLHVIACRGWGHDDMHVRRLTFPTNDPGRPNYYVMTHHRPLLVRDARQEFPLFVDGAETLYTGEIRAMLVVPLLHHGHIIGMISIDKYTPNYYTDEMAEIALTFATIAAAAISNAQYYAQARRHEQGWSRLEHSSRKLLACSTLDDMYRYWANEGADLFDAENCTIYLVQSRTRLAMLATSSGFVREHPAPGLRLDGSSLAAYVACTGVALNRRGHHCQVHPDGRTVNPAVLLGPLQQPLSEGVHSLLITPIRDASGQLLGVIQLTNRRRNDTGSFKPFRVFSHFDKILADNFAAQLGNAIELRRQMRDGMRTDMHDMMNHMCALVQRANYAREVLRTSPGDVVEVLEQFRYACNYVYERLSYLHDDVRDSVLQNHGLFAALRRHARTLNMQRRVRFKPRTVQRLPATVEYALCKIGCEALCNANKHRGDAVVTVLLRLDEDGFVFEVVNTGNGFDYSAQLKNTKRFGLESMTRTAKSIRAELEVVSQEGVPDTCIVVRGQFREAEHAVEHSRSGGR